MHPTRSRVASPRLVGVASVLALAAVLWLVYGRGFVGYDGMYGLIWGRDMAHGRVPDFAVEGAPTPHPLVNVVAAVISPLGDGAIVLLSLASTLAFAAAGYAAFQLGRGLFSAQVGALFAALLLTREPLVHSTYQALVEIPFLALVLWGLVLEVRRPRAGVPVLVLLLLAGLLRPEGWLLLFAYAVYLVPPLGGRERLRIVALAAAAPLLWAIHDLAITGDPLHSLHHTQTGADLNLRPRTFDVALQAAPVYLEDILNTAAVWGGLAGCLLGLFLLYRRSLLPAVVLGIGLVTFLALGFAGVSLLPRYYYLAAAMLALFCAVAVFGWRHLPAEGRPWGLWRLGGAAVAAALVISIPSDYDRLSGLKSASLTRRDLERDLRELVRSPGARQWVRRCAPTLVAEARMVPLVAYWLDARVGAEVYVPPAAALFAPSTRGVFVGPSPSTHRSHGLDPRSQAYVSPTPDGFGLVADNRQWALYERC